MRYHLMWKPGYTAIEVLSLQPVQHRPRLVVVYVEGTGYVRRAWGWYVSPVKIFGD